MENNKGQTIFLSVIGVATLLVAIIGATFAYFTASVTGNEGASSIIVNTATIASIEFTDTSALTLDNILPGTSANKNFTVKVLGDVSVDMNYRILLSYTNEGVTDLFYTLSYTTCTGGTCVVSSTADETHLESGAAGNLGTAGKDNMIIGTGTFTADVAKANDTHTWNIVVNFPETGTDQNAQQGHDFYGRIQVDFAGGSNIIYNSANPEGSAFNPAP